MNIRYTPRAVSDLLAIAEYLYERNPSAAVEAEATIRATIDRLRDFPEIGRRRLELDARAIGVRRYPYTIYYRIEHEAVWILHIRDARRRPLAPGDV